jgi:hypothetical protein
MIEWMLNEKNENMNNSTGRNNTFIIVGTRDNSRQTIFHLHLFQHLHKLLLLVRR